MKEEKKDLLNISILVGIAIIYTILVKFIDVLPIGPNNSLVGFGHLNDFFRNIIGYNEIFYNLTKYLELIPFLLIGYYATCGLLQLIRNKSLKKVDSRLIILGIYYVVIGVVYIFFEKVIINYRPILMDNMLEASYPSSHTMLALTICLSSLLISKYYFPKKYLKITNILIFIVMILLVLGRLLSGVHWVTDIIGGIIISISLVAIYNYFIDKFNNERS